MRPGSATNLGEMVHGTVEETLNAMLDAEADHLCGTGRYQRSADRVDTRAGSYDRTLHTSAGEVKLKVLKLRQQIMKVRTGEIKRFRLSTSRGQPIRRASC